MDIGYNNITYLNTNVTLINQPTTQEGEAIAKRLHTKDLMYVMFELCHANINRNHDEFLPKELYESHDTIIDKPINWEHTSEVIGHVYNSQYVKHAEADVNTNTDKIICEGVVYKYKFPNRAKTMLERYEDKRLFFSMETYFEKAKCSICEKEFNWENEYCEHLKRRFDGSGAARILLGNLFGGVGCVSNPADDARGLSIASRKILTVRKMIDIFGDRFSPEEYIKVLRSQNG